MQNEILRRFDENLILKGDKTQVSLLKRDLNRTQESID